MSADSAIRIVDTTLRDGSHAIAHQYRVDQVATVAARARPRRRLGDRRRPRRRAGRELDPVRASAALRRRAAGRGGRASSSGREIAVAILPGIGTKARPRGGARRRRDGRAGLDRLHRGRHRRPAPRPRPRARHDRAQPPQHRAPARRRRAWRRQSRVVADAGSQGVFIVDSAGAFLTDDVRRRIAAMRAALPDDVAVGIHEHNNLSLAVANSAAAIEEGATLVDTSLAGLGAGAGNCQTEALVAVLERMGIDTGIDLWALQDVADDGRARRDHAAADRDRPPDRDDGLRGRARQLPPARDPRRRALRARSARDHRRARQAQGRRRPGGRDHRDRRRDGGGGGTTA